MAVGDKLLTTWISGVWNEINRVVRNISNGLSTLTAYSSKVSASDISNLNAKINQIKSDYYLSSEASIFVTQGISAGTKINNTTKSSIDTMIGNSAKLICKNTAAYSNGTNSNGSNSNGTNSHGASPTYSQGTCSNGEWSRSSTSNSQSGCSGNNTVKNGEGSSYNSNGNMSNGNSKTTHANGTKYSHTICTANGSCTSHGSCTAKGTVIDLRNSNSTRTS